MLPFSISQVLRTPVRALALAVACAFSFAAISTPAHATLPGTIKPGHPRLFTSSANLANLKSQIALAPANFPSDGGTISFDFMPRAKLATDKVNASLFGDYDSSKNTIFMRHVDKYDTATKNTFQIALQQPNATSYVAVATVEVNLDQWSTITLSWDSTARTISAKVNGVTVPMSWRADAGNWQASQQIFKFTPRKNEALRNFRLLDKAQNEVSRFDTVDVPLSLAWTDFIHNADVAKATLAACGTAPVDVNDKTICNVATGHRILITDAAQQLALAYRISGDSSYLTAAQTFINRMFSVPLATGTEWTMGGRVGAMAILYDWLYDEMGSIAVPNDNSGRSYRTALAQTIKATIAANSAKPSDDLNNSICGPQLLSSSGFDCAQKPVFENWNRFARPLPPSIAQYYITGHNFSAVNEITLGLLAIGDEYSEVLPMLDTAWTHFEKGFMPARSIISVDGGHHTGYAYGIAAMPERVLMWRNALTNTSGPIFVDDWQAKLVYPYIYGLRSDNTYPARGDDFGKSVWEYDVGYLALWAASIGNDSTAWAFYKNVVLPARTNNAPMVLERLYWPLSMSETPVANLDLSRHFRVAGSVVMRDSWDFANATLLDFKSSNLASENHQHLDQNSFSLYYKAPLLLDSGLYDDYGSPHWQHYFTRSVAHNTITVFDPSERFVKNGIEYSNDGGQWYPATNGVVSTLYPTLDEIKPGAVNYLDGVTAYESAANWSFVTGNASRAYSAGKLDQSNGFLRSVVFLRAPQFWQKPVTVVFDSVRSKNSLPATFVLHPAGDPASDVTPQSLGNGQYKLPFAANAARQLTIRNGSGMLTAQTLLPVNANVLKVGGTSGVNCSQIDTTSGSFKGLVNADCRFTARERQSDNSFVWRNYPVKYNADGVTTPQAHVSPEIGSWRLEITSPDAVTPGSTQYFLNVYSVADNNGLSGNAAAPLATRLTADANTEAVLLGERMVVAFNRGSSASGSMSWQASRLDLSMLLTGLKANTAYSLSSTPAGNGFQFSLQESASGTYQSSAQGVISINL